MAIRREGLSVVGVGSTPSSLGDMTPRIAVADDLDAITRLINAAFAVERFFIDGDRIDVKKVRDLFGNGRFLLVEDDNGLAGCVYVEVRGDRGYLGLLSVEPARQGAGLGRRLAIAAEGCLRAAGCHAIDLAVVNLRPELLSFYRRLGYTETGTAPFPPEKSTKLLCHFVTMSKTLEKGEIRNQKKNRGEARRE
jgi:GNAT superfamily N-acetyltransferase